MAGKSEDELERLIAKLQLGEFVYEQPSIVDVEYIFKHALTQEVAYNSVLLERRKQLHEHAGNAIETIYTSSLDDHLADLAYHFSRSRNPEKAVWTAYIATRGYAAPEVGPVFVRARELCERIGQPTQLFAVVWGNFAWHVVRGEMGLSMDWAREAMALAERFDDPGIWMEALFLLGVTLFYRGDFVGAIAQYEKALSHYDDRESTRLWASRVGEDAGITHRCYLSLALWQLGYPEQAVCASWATMDLARSIGHPFSLAYAQHHRSWLYHRLRLPADTEAASEEGIQTATEQGFALFHATGTIYKAGGLLLEGRPNEALPMLTRGLEAYRATGAGMSLPYYFSILGDAYTQVGKPEEAGRALDEGLAIAERNDELCQLAELYRLKGELALRTGSPNMGAAEDFFRKAIWTAQRQLSKSWELRATISLARLCQQQGRHDEARRTLSDIYGWFTEGFDTPDLKAAQALLDEAGRLRRRIVR